MASLGKKRRLGVDELDLLPNVEEDTIHRFSNETDKVESLKSLLDDLSAKASAVGTLSINQCNAAYGRYGKPGKSFASADVDVKLNYDTYFTFASIFRKGVNMLETYLENPTVAPTDRHMALVLSTLLAYLLDKDEHEAVMSIRNEKTKEEEDTACESDLAVRFAQHFFGKLAGYGHYTLDKHHNNKMDKCGCGCNTYVAEYYGDTSIGNTKVWHGHIDILLSGCVPVTVKKEKPLDSQGGESSVKFKVDEDLQEVDVKSQTIAKAIVFSFTQKKNQPEYKHFLIPTIGISRKNIIFYFYESEHDILLTSPPIPLFWGENISDFAILSTWFVVNYKFLCTGLSKEMITLASKANFFKLADDQLEIYHNKVSLGGVAHAKPKPELFQPAFWPSKDLYHDKSPTNK